jgi:hypothetical protein
MPRSDASYGLVRKLVYDDFAQKALREIQEMRRKRRRQPQGLPSLGIGQRREMTNITNETPLEQIREKYERVYQRHGPTMVSLVDLLKDLRAGTALEYWLNQGVEREATIRG